MKCVQWSEVCSNMIILNCNDVWDSLETRTRDFGITMRMSSNFLIQVFSDNLINMSHLKGPSSGVG